MSELLDVSAKDLPTGLEDWMDKNYPGWVDLDDAILDMACEVFLFAFELGKGID